MICQKQRLRRTPFLPGELHHFLHRRMPHHKGLLPFILFPPLLPPPKHIKFILHRQRHIGIDPRVTEKVILILILNRQIHHPLKQFFLCIRIHLIQLFQRFQPAVIQPGTRIIYNQVIIASTLLHKIGRHHHFMIAHQADHNIRILLLQRKNILQTPARIRAPVNVIPQKNQQIFIRVESDFVHQLY